MKRTSIEVDEQLLSIPDPGGDGRRDRVEQLTSQPAERITPNG